MIFLELNTLINFLIFNQNLKRNTPENNE
jgi:hypothetical protein